MGTQSYRPWGERLLSKHKLFLSQDRRPCILHCNAITDSFQFIQKVTEVTCLVFKDRGLWFTGGWPAWEDQLANHQITTLSSSRYLLMKTAGNFKTNQKFSAAIVLPLESWTVCSALAYSSWALRSLRLFHIINIPSWPRKAGKLLLLGDSLGNHTER